MVKIYGKGDTVSSSEFWDGRTNNNLLQDFTTNDINSLKDIIQPIKEIIDQSSEIQDLLERITPITNDGVYANSLNNECVISTSDVVSITIMGESKVYTRLTPGIIQFNSNVFINKPATVLASKQIEKILKIERSNLESVEIKYSYITDSFKCKISKKFTTGNPSTAIYFPSALSWNDDELEGYTHSATLLSSIINNTLLNDYFNRNIGNDITKINLEYLVELTSTGTYYWIMNSSGNIELTETLGVNFKICNFTYNSIPITSIDNTHTTVEISSGGGIGNGTAQYQMLITGATPYTPSWTAASNLVGSSGLNSLSWASGSSFVKMTAAGTFGLDTNTFINTSQNTLIKDPTGFSEPSLVIVTYDPTAQKITLSGAGWKAYWRGIEVTALVNGWVSTGHPTVTGHDYLLYYNGTSFVWADNSFPGFDMLLIADVNYGDTDKYAVRECHGFMQWQVHQAEHSTIGSYRSSGGTIPSASYALLSTTAVDRRPNIDQTVMWDEDCPTTLSALTTELYTRYNLTGASVGAYSLGATDIIPLLVNNPYYNSFATPNWGQTLFPSNSVGSVWVYAMPVDASTGSQAYRYLFVQPQWITQALSGSAGSMTTARNTELLRNPSELNLGTLIDDSPEMVIIARIVVQYTTNWSLGNVVNVTGNRYSQIGSPSGSYLSTVATNGGLSGDGTGLTPLINTLSTGVAGGQTIYGGTLTTEVLNIRGNIADTTSGQVNFTGTKTATTTSNASVTFAGGIGIAGNLIINSLTGLLKSTSGLISVASAGSDYENALTFGSGVTRAVNAISNDLITGKAGGQTIIGGTATTDPLIYKTTAGVGTTGSDHIFQVGSNGAIEALRVTSAGVVGIGTTAPDKKVEINSATGACLRLTYNDSNGSATYYSDLSISSAGNLTIAPSGGTTNITGICSATSFDAVSKRSTKKNIEPFTKSALNLISEIQVSSFQFKTATNDNIRVGFIADDTNILFSGESQDHMDMTNCIGILLKAVQELNDEVKRLKEVNSVK